MPLLLLRRREARPLLLLRLPAAAARSFFWLLLRLFFWLLLTPIVWAAEMLGSTNPIFLPAQGSSYLVPLSLKSAAIWTYMTFQGAQLARPNSPVVRATLLPILRAGNALIGIIATAAMAAIFTLDASKAEAISELSDLTARHIVCYNGASSFNTRLVTQHANELGFQTVELDGLAVRAAAQTTSQ